MPPSSRLLRPVSVSLEDAIKRAQSANSLFALAGATPKSRSRNIPSPARFAPQCRLPQPVSVHSREPARRPPLPSNSSPTMPFMSMSARHPSQKLSAALVSPTISSPPLRPQPLMRGSKSLVAVWWLPWWQTTTTFLLPTQSWLRLSARSTKPTISAPSPPNGNQAARSPMPTAFVPISRSSSASASSTTRRLPPIAPASTSASCSSAIPARLTHLRHRSTNFPLFPRAPTWRPWPWPTIRNSRPPWNLYARPNTR